MAAGLAEAAGVRRGDVVAVTLADRPRLAAVVLGAARLGAVCALVEPAHAARARWRDALAAGGAAPWSWRRRRWRLPATPPCRPSCSRRLGAGPPRPRPGAHAATATPATCS